MKRLYMFLLVSLFGFAIGFGITKVTSNADSAEGQYLDDTSSGMLANWVSTEVKIEELVRSSDLIVRVRVTSQDTRLLEHVLPVYTVAGADSSTPLEELDPSSEAEQIGERKLVTPFTDSTMEVIEVYKGSADESITVMQTGGEIPVENGDDITQKMSPQGDPLYNIDSEHVLFLINISGDEIHAENRVLYRIASPAGRYIVQGERVATTINPQELSEEPVTLPTTIDELVDEIRKQVNNP